jgi:polyisoprenoid-binding protein YceI
MRTYGLAIAVWFVFAAITARAERFEIEAGDEANLVKFQSKAPMESFTGKTSSVSGHIEFDPAAIGDSVDVLVRVDLASLDTGISLRNQHMRDNHLHTETYPHATFRGATVIEGGGSVLAAGAQVRFVIEGTMNLHGVERRIRVPVTVSAVEEDRTRVRIRSEFDVFLADYDIPRPKFLFLKLDEKQRIQLDLYATAAVTVTR